MTRWLMKLCLMSAACLAAWALAEEAELPIRVTDLRAPARDWVAALELDLAQATRVLGPAAAAAPERVQVWETDVAGQAMSRKWAQFIPAAGGAGASAGALFWLMDGYTRPGAERRFVVCMGEARSGVAPRGGLSGVRVRRQGSRVAVSNDWFEVVHDAKRGGTIVEAAFAHSGRRVAVQMKDSMRAKELFEIARDDAAEVIVRDAGPPRLAVIVEARGRFTRPRAKREECPRVLYRYIYTAHSPLVRIECLAPEQAAAHRFGNVQQFVFDMGRANPFTRVGRIVASAAGPLMETEFQWSPCEARPLAGALLANDADAFGIITPLIGTYSIDKEGMHVKHRGFLSAWMGAELRTGASLYLGPAGAAARYLPLAEPPRVRAVIAHLAQRIDAAAGGSQAQAMLRRAAQRRIDAARSLPEAEELIAAAESLARQPRQGDEPAVVETRSFLALAHGNTGMLWRFGSRVAARAAGAEAFEFVRLDGLFREGHAFLQPAEGPRAFWRAWCRDTQTGGWVGVSPERAGLVRRRVEREGPRRVRLHLTWPNIAAGPGRVRAEATILLDPDSALPRWRIAVEPLSDRLSVWEVAFPIVAGITRDRAAGGTDFLLFPYKSGAALPNPARAGLWEFLYPGAAGWPFLAYWQGRAGLYAAALDPAAGVKTLKALPCGRGALELRFTHPVPNRGEPGAGFDMPFDCVVAAFDGDWYDAAQLYREWLLRQCWVPRVPLHANDGIPQWLKDCCVATRRSGTPEHAVHTYVEEHASGFKEWHMGVVEEHEALGSPPTLMWWYHAWHKRAGVDRKFADAPDFAPPPKFAEGVRELKQRGIRVVGYSLSYWWDYSAPSWKRDRAEEAVIIREDGSPWLYHRRGVGIMCPAAKLYQEKMQRVMLGLLDQGPVDGAYFDLGGTAGASACYSKTHGHPVGAGGFITAGKHALLAGMRAAAQRRRPEFALIIEGNADCYLDAVDGYCLFASNTPVRQALYADYLRPAGAKRCRVARSPLEAINPAKHFAWGALLGRLYGNELLTRGKTDPKKVQYYKRLVRYKLAARPWLNYGRMRRPLRLTNLVPPDPPELVEGAMVPAAVWEAPDGSVAFVFANARLSAPVSFRYVIEPAAYGIPADGSAGLYKLTPGGAAAGAQYEKQAAITGPMRRRVTLPPGGALVLVARWR